MKDLYELQQQRLISLLSHFGKTYRQVLARRMRVVLQSKLRDTQSLEYNEGCSYNSLILTQKVGERLEADVKTSACVIDLQKTFDTVKRRLLWARLRSLGIHSKLLRALRGGYGDRLFVGKLGATTSTARRDIGLGTRQGEVDSSDAFAAFIDDLDSEIERHEAKIGRRLGIPLAGVAERKSVMLSVLKHADDTVLISSSEEDLQALLNILAVWCQKWQLTPQALKCDCVVFENTGFTRPELQFSGEVLLVKRCLLGLLAQPPRELASTCRAKGGEGCKM